jgi:hypothetical protein
VIVEADGMFSFKFDGITHYGKLGAIRNGPAPSNAALNVELVEDANLLCKISKINFAVIL